MKKNTLISMALAVSLLFGSSVTAFASEDKRNTDEFQIAKQQCLDVTEIVKSNSKLDISKNSISQNAYSISEATSNSGWVNQDGKWYLYENGKKRTGPIIYQGKKYLLNNEGAMVTGWQYLTGLWYYFDKDSGAMKTGWLNDYGTWYHFDNYGRMETGLVAIDDAIYLLSAEGKMCTGWIQGSNNKWWYFNDNGTMHLGWLNLNGSWYYLNYKDGCMLTGLWVVDNGRYYFNDSGVMQTGWHKLKDFWKYFDESGVVHVGWLYNNGSWYYMNNNGDMLTGSWYINGVLYHFNSSGRMQ